VSPQGASIICRSSWPCVSELRYVRPFAQLPGPVAGFRRHGGAPKPELQPTTDRADAIPHLGGLLLLLALRRRKGQLSNKSSSNTRHHRHLVGVFPCINECRQAPDPDPQWSFCKPALEEFSFISHSTPRPSASCPSWGPQTKMRSSSQLSWRWTALFCIFTVLCALFTPAGEFLKLGHA
jgi:hypothetical protein